jgi:hypothetical protein
MTACASSPGTPFRSALRGLVVGRALAVVLGASAALAAPGCWAAEPQLYPFDPPPNVPAGLTLLEIPGPVIQSLYSQRVADQLGELLLVQDMKLDRPRVTPERREQILAHRVVTGMTMRDVVFCFLSDPSRQRIQGPPGGQTLLWEPRDTRLDRFWVRFDEYGKAADAGRY